MAVGLRVGGSSGQNGLFSSGAEKSAALEARRAVFGRGRYLAIAPDRPEILCRAKPRIWGGSTAEPLRDVCAQSA